MSLLLNAEREGSFRRPDSLATHDLDRALVEAAEEIEIDWPESLPVEQIKAGVTEIALGFLLCAGLLLFCAAEPLFPGEVREKACSTIVKFLFSCEDFPENSFASLVNRPCAPPRMSQRNFRAPEAFFLESNSS